MSIDDDYQVYAKINVDVREYGTAADNQLACSILSELQNKIRECHQTIKDALVHNLSSVTEVLHYMQGSYFVHNPPFSLSCVFLFLKLDADELASLLSETFKPDEEFVFGPQSMLDQNQIIFHSQESLSFDGVCYF